MRIVIVSLNFSVGHIAHLKAYYHLCIDCGFQTTLYLQEQYLKYIDPQNYAITTKLSDLVIINPKVVLLYNVAITAMKFVRFCKIKHWTFIYVLHEPFPGFKEILKDGKYLPKILAANLVNFYICSQSDKVLLASKRAEQCCKKYMPFIYRKSVKFPLIFMDESGTFTNVKRKYFSIIGGFDDSHAPLKFVNFIKESFNKPILFQIATKMTITRYLEDPLIRQMMCNGQLIVQQGKPLTSTEINTAYRNSICVWNAYRRSTQSGVLANAFMLGTPVIATSIGSFPEFVKPGETGEFIDNYETESILNAYNKIASNIDKMEKACRNEFLEKFYYKHQVERFKQIVGK